jgi:hypothetical protein
LTSAECQAAAAADKVRWEIEDRLDRRFGPAATAPARCEREFPLHLRRTLRQDTDGTEGIEDIIFMAKCGNHECPYCWMQRVRRTVRRALACLLDDPRDDRLLPRLGLVHVAETTWKEWPAFDRDLCKAMPRAAGRLRVRRGNDSVLVIAEAPFPGSRPASPVEAAQQAAAAIEQLHTGKHAFRLLGHWNDRQASPWKLVSRLDKPLDPGLIDQLLAAAGNRARRLKRLRGLVFRSDTLGEAAAIGRRLERQILAAKSIDDTTGSSKRRHFSGSAGDGRAAGAGAPNPAQGAAENSV